MERSKGENVRNFFLFILYYYYDKKCKVVNSTSLYHASLTELGLKDSKIDSESLSLDAVEQEYLPAILMPTVKQGSWCLQLHKGASQISAGGL